MKVTQNKTVINKWEKKNYITNTKMIASLTDCKERENRKLTYETSMVVDLYVS